MLLNVLSLLTACSYGQPSQAAVPGQFIAKLHTEALGRTPSPAEWSTHMQLLADRGCQVRSLALPLRATLLGAEFDRSRYTHAQKLLLAYRTILDREPDAGGFQYFLRRLGAGESFGSVVDSLLGSAEFSMLAARICSGDPYYFNTLGRGGYAIPLPDAPPISQSALERMLASAKPGETVALPPATLVYLNSTLVVPVGVTLMTAGAPTPINHGKMARLVRGPVYTSKEALVRVAAGASLRNVWIDGQRGAVGYRGNVAQPFVHNQINVQALSGAGTSVSSNFIANTAGWSSLQAVGIVETQVACRSNAISGNLITAYPSNNTDVGAKSWADGISVSCEDSVVENNQIVDATDGGIVLFRAQVGGRGSVQRSQVTDNVILNAGNPAYVGIAIDPLYVSGGCSAMPSFRGSYVGRNALWTGPNAVVEVGLAVGTGPWFSRKVRCLGTGATVSDNHSFGLPVRTNNGIAVQGMLDATVQANRLSFTPARKGRCQMVQISAGVTAGIASGRLQRYSDAALEDCI